MNNKLSILQWEIEYDSERTMIAYKKPTEICKCKYCTNFLLAQNNFPKEYFNLLGKLGIDPKLPAEIVEYTENGNGYHLYGWWYHINGRIINGTNKKQLFLPGIEVLLREESQLAHKNIPKPIVQIEFWMNIPWLLDEKQ